LLGRGEPCVLRVLLGTAVELPRGEEQVARQREADHGDDQGDPAWGEKEPQPAVQRWVGSGCPGRLVGPGTRYDGAQVWRITVAGGNRHTSCDLTSATMPGAAARSIASTSRK